ncbi:Enterochelin esterase [compost metagenome]
MNGINPWGCGLLLALAMNSAMATTSLMPGQTVKGSVAQAQQPDWTLRLQQGDFVRGRVDGDISLRLLDAQGQSVRVLVDGQDQPRDFMFIAPASGDFRLHAEPLATRPKADYALSLSQVVSVAEQKVTRPALQSPLMRQLQQQLLQGLGTQAFWAAREAQGTPLVEPLVDKPGYSLVTFLWRGAQHNVRVFGAPSGNHDELQRLGDSDVWFRSYEVPSSARLSYQMAADVPPSNDRRVILATTRRDPLNPDAFADSSGDPWLSRSRLELPDAPAQPWVAERQGVARGTVERQVLGSHLLGNERDVYLYRPAGWIAGAPGQGLLVLFDAHAYTRQVPTPTLLDNLIADGLIPATAALIIANPSDLSRQQELPPNPQFARFMAEELMPWAKARGLRADASRTVVAGSSYGGLASAYMGLKHPEWFGNVLSMSGSYWWGRDGEEPGWLTREYVKAPKQPLRFYLQSGLFEGPKILDTNRHMRDVLLAKGYAVTQVEYPAGHDYLQWRGSLPCGLIALIGKAGEMPKVCQPG